MAKPRYGLIGKNISYSYSPKIHQHLNPNITYELIDCENLAIVQQLLQKRDFKAVNVTIPYKEQVLPLLDQLSPEAAAIQAVNTIVNKNHQLIGYNTDIDGFEKTLLTFNTTFKNALILGSGGSSKAVSYVLKKHQIDYQIVSRSGDKGIDYQTAITLQNTDLIINTTPLGSINMIDQQPIDLAYFPKLKGVIDLIYNPKQTLLLKQAETLNIPYQNGLLMLIEQARKSQTYW